MSLTLADVVVLAIVALSTLVALIRGFVREALSILAWAGAALITAYLFDPLRPLADDMIASETAGDIATIAVIFLVSLLILSVITRAIGDIVSGSPFTFLDRVLGAGFGIARGLAVMAVIYMGLLWVWGPNGEPDWVRRSETRPMVVGAAQVIQGVVPERMRNQFLERADQAANATAGAAADAARGTLGSAMPGMSRDGAAQAPAAGRPPSGNAAGATPSGGEIGYGDGARHDMNRLLDAIEPGTAAPSGGDQTSGAGAN